MAALLAVSIGAVVCDAQRQTGALTPTPVTLRLTITIDGDVERAELVTVELMDAVGGSNEMSRKLTDSDGRVTFQTLSGMHRIRISGPNIQTYDGELEITRNEVSHLERIRVHRAASGQQAGSAPGGSAPASRLNIP